MSEWTLNKIKKNFSAYFSVSYPSYVLWLAQGLLCILQPGLQRGDSGAILLPVAQDLLQHAPHTAHFHGQTPPLSHHLPHEPAYSNLTFIHWRTGTFLKELFNADILLN